jgi:hypothetical protein
MYISKIMDFLIEVYEKHGDLDFNELETEKGGVMKIKIEEMYTIRNEDNTKNNIGMKYHQVKKNE